MAAGKCGCELVVPDPEDITFLEAEKFASKVDYGGYTVPLAFLGRHAAGSAAMAVELSLALCRKGFDITDDAILEGNTDLSGAVTTDGQAAGSAN